MNTCEDCGRTGADVKIEDIGTGDLAALCPTCSRKLDASLLATLDSLRAALHG